MTLKGIREGNTLRRTFRDAFSCYLYLQEYLCRGKVYVNLWAAANLWFGQMVKGNKFGEKMTRGLRNKYMARTISE